VSSKKKKKKGKEEVKRCPSLRKERKKKRGGEKRGVLLAPISIGTGKSGGLGEKGITARSAYRKGRKKESNFVNQSEGGRGEKGGKSFIPREKEGGFQAVLRLKGVQKEQGLSRHISLKKKGGVYSSVLAGRESNYEERKNNLWLHTDYG